LRRADPAQFGLGPAHFSMAALSGNGAVPSPRRYRAIWSAGHSASGVRDVPLAPSWSRWLRSTRRPAPLRRHASASS
jgi:hypothetical protein